MVKELLTRGEVRARLGVGNWTVDRWVRGGLLRRVVLPGMKHGRYLREDVEGLEDGCKVNAERLKG